jgi:hypothetical protein
MTRAAWLDNSSVTSGNAPHEYSYRALLEDSALQVPGARRCAARKTARSHRRRNNPMARRVGRASGHVAEHSDKSDSSEINAAENNEAAVSD